MKTGISWFDYLIPLPQEFEVCGEVNMTPGQVGLVVALDASPMVIRAVEELRIAYRDRCGCDPSGESFTIHIGRLSELRDKIEEYADADERLRQAPHSDQAYVIRPAGDSALVVAGLEDRGVFYGIQTLRQLLTARLTEAQVIVPVATITDWPDFEERGLWNSGLRAPAHLSWMAGMKLNFEHINHPLDFEPDNSRCPPLPKGDISEARDRAIHIMPHCWHYDFWSDALEMRSNYPELVGKGDSAKNPVTVRDPGYHPEARCPCASSPLLRKLLAEWMESAGEQGVREVSLWLTEYQPSTCGCDTCAGEGSHQLVRETRESIHAIRDAQRAYPDLVVRLFLTFNVMNPEEERACREALSLVPTDGSIRVEVVYGLQGPFEEYAKAGNWVSHYGIGTAIGSSYRSRGSLRPRFYSDPEMLQERVAHLYDSGYEGLYNISVISAGGEEKGEVERSLCDFHISMLAEWFWNAKGRDGKQFIRAWVASHGYTQPEDAVRWIERMMPVESVLVTAMNALPDMIEAICSNKLLRLGESPGLEVFPDEDSLDKWIRTASRCEASAEQMGASDMVAESRCVGSALRVLRGIYRLSKAVAGTDHVIVAKAWEDLTGVIEEVIAAAKGQTAVWITMPLSIAEQFDQHTTDYWKNLERTLLRWVN
jgi:hypothetical protein